MLDHDESQFRDLPPHKHGVSHIVALHCYLDDSDNHNGPVLGIAGYVSTVESWTQFEEAAKPYLAEWGVETLRGKDFHNGHGSFKNWSKEKKFSFSEGLFDISGIYVLHGASTIVSKKDFKKLKAQDKGFANMSALGLGFGYIVHSLLCNDPVSKRITPESKVSFVVENGNKNNANILHYFTALKSMRAPELASIGSIEFVDKRACVAVQLADFLAFHARRGSEYYPTKNWPAEDPKGAIFALMSKNSIPHRINRFYTQTGTPPRIPFGYTYAGIWCPWAE